MIGLKLAGTGIVLFVLLWMTCQFIDEKPSEKVLFAVALFSIVIVLMMTSGAILAIWGI